MTSVQNPLPLLSGSRKSLLFILGFVFLVACNNGEKTSNPEQSLSPTNTNEFYTVQLRVKVGQASVFAQPNRRAEVIYTLVEGDTVTAVGRSDADELGTIFYAVEIGDMPGWVAETQVEPQSDPEGLIVIPRVAFDATTTNRDPNAPPTPAIGVVARPYGADAPIYAAPDSTSEIIRMAGTTETLEVVFVTNYTFETRYFGVRLVEGFGWIDERDFQVLGDIQTLTPVTIGTPVPTQSEAQPSSFPPTPTVAPTNSSAATSTRSTLMPTTIARAATNTPSSVFQPTQTLTPTIVGIQPIDPPPLTLTLPNGWESEHVQVPISSAFDNDSLNLSLYEGPLTNAERGYIWVLWRFDVLLDETGELSLWPNALLYLRSFLFRGCNIGVYPDQRREYAIGDRIGSGTIYSAVGCGPDAPDVAGWLITLSVGDENYLFYIGISPAENVSLARDEMQAILNSIRFETSS